VEPSDLVHVLRFDPTLISLVVKPDRFPSGVAKSVLTLFSVEHTNALDREVVGNPLAEPPSTGRSNRLGGPV
jgi:hypothetical protein